MPVRRTWGLLAVVLALLTLAAVVSVARTSAAADTRAEAGGGFAVAGSGVLAIGTALTGATTWLAVRAGQRRLAGLAGVLVAGAAVVYFWAGVAAATRSEPYDPTDLNRPDQVVVTG